MINMTAQAAAYLYTEKKLPVRAIAEQLSITRSAVYNALVRAGAMTRVPVGSRQERERLRYGPIDEGSLHFVQRDPCFKCGTRADVGCRHRRVA